MNPELLNKIIEAGRSRAGTLQELADLSGFFFSLPDYAPSLLVPKNGTSPKTKSVLLGVQKAFETLNNTERATVSSALDVIINEEGRGAVLWPLRVALSGQAASPDPLEIAEVLGLEETNKRINQAIEKLS
jgi:glutamyl/glutaminyl-tRNA synthetase